MKRNLKWLTSLAAATALSFSVISLPANAAAGACEVTSSADSGANTLRDCFSKIGTTGYESGIDITFAVGVTAIQLNSPIVVNAVPDLVDGMAIDVTGPVTVSPSLSFAAGDSDRLLEINIDGTGALNFDQFHFSNATHGAMLVTATYWVEFTMFNSMFLANSTGAGSDDPEGGAIKVSATYANLWFNGNSFSGNSSYSHGGAIYSDSVSGTANLNDSYTSNNSLGNGGVIAATGRVVTGFFGAYDNDTTFTSNTAAGNGGAIYSGALTQTFWTAFASNAATNGAAIYSATEYVQLDYSQFTANTATGRGGAVYQASGEATMVESHFENNTAGFDGGAVYLHNDPASETMIFQSSFFANTAGGDGGAFFTNNALKIGHTTFSTNSAVSEGGGLYAGTGAIIAFTTMLGNSADTSPDVHIASGAGTSIGSIYASLTPADTGNRFNAVTGAYPGNFSTGLEGAFTTLGNYQGVTLDSLELASTASQFTTRRYDFEYVEYVTSNTTKGYVPATTSPLVGKVSIEQWDDFVLNGWAYIFYNDQTQDSFIESGPYTSGSVHLVYEGDGGGDGEGPGEGGGGDESGDVTIDPTTPNLSITSVSKSTITGSGDSFVVYGRGLSDVTNLMIGDTEVVFSVNPDGSLRVTSPVLAYGQHDLKAISPDGQAVLLKALWVVDTLQFSTWTKRSGDSIKVYAKNVIGVGKVQFFVDGREIAWVNSVDSTDPKLRTANGFHYLVRTVDLKLDGSKTRFEVKLNGERVRRNTYTVNGN